MNQIKSQLVLVVSDEGVMCVPFNISGAPAPFFCAIHDRAAMTTILGLAARYSRIPITILADTLAQDIKRDTLQMRLAGFDKAKLIKRRLQQAFPNTPLRSSLKVKSNRAQVLFAGLRNDGPIQLWLQKLAALRSKNMPQLCLLPMECAGLISKLIPGAGSGWAMLLSWQRTGGFRQIVTHDGEIVFSRLTPSLPLSVNKAEFVGSIVRDVKATRGYLARHGLDEKAMLRAAFILPNAIHAELLNAGMPVHDPLLLSPHEAAWKLNLPSAPLPDDPYSDWLCACWFAQKKKPELVMLPPELKRLKQANAVASWALRAAVILLIFAIGFAGMNAGDLFLTLQDKRDQSFKLSNLRKQFAQEQRAAEPVTEPLGKLRQALERDHFYSMPMPSPRAALVQLNEGLGASARLVKFDWLNDSGKPGEEVLHVSAKLTQAPNLSDRETTVARFQNVAQSLTRAMPGYIVAVERYPFPALPQETLSNESHGDKPSAEPTADFSIRRTP